MRGGFVACFGGGLHTRARLESIAGFLRWHSGSPETYEAGPLAAAVLADTDHGPAVSVGRDRGLLIHGAESQPLGALQRGHERFAALEWDDRSVRASRDPLGEVPLFFRILDGAAWLATEIHPLVAVAPTALDLDALAADAAFVPYGMRTGRKDILRVPPGSTVTIEATMRLSVSAYWQPESRLGTRSCSYPEAVQEFRERFETAVARRRGHAPGVLLSGGLDSSAVAVAARDAGDPPHLVTVAFPDLPDTDETDYARAAAEATGAPLTVLQGHADPWDAEAEAGIFGTPSMLAPTGMFETAATSFARAGTRQILDGHDGDGALGFCNDIYGLLLSHLQIRCLIGLARRYGRRNVPLRALREAVPPSLRSSRSRAAALEANPSLMRNLAPYFGGATLQRMEDEMRWRSPRRSWRHDQLLPLIPPLTLSFEQLETEAARLGVDLLHPFADRDLLDFLVSLPFSVKVDPERSKPLLRDGLADLLPDAIVSRAGKVWFNSVLERRVDPQICLRWIRESGVRLPDLDYQAMFQAVDRDPDSLFTLGWVRLARVHLFAAST